MPRWALVLLSVFAVIGVLYSAMLTVLWIGPAEGLCVVYPVMNVPSTSGKFRAEVKTEICESKNKHQTIVWLTDGIPVNLGGHTWSALIADSTQKHASGSYSPLNLQLAWLSDSELEISYPTGTELSSSARTQYGVKVIYRERNSP